MSAADAGDAPKGVPDGRSGRLPGPRPAAGSADGRRPPGPIGAPECRGAAIRGVYLARPTARSGGGRRAHLRRRPVGTPRLGPAGRLAVLLQDVADYVDVPSGRENRGRAQRGHKGSPCVWCVFAIMLLIRSPSRCSMTSVSLCRPSPASWATSAPGATRPTRCPPTCPSSGSPSRNRCRRQVVASWTSGSDG